MQNTTKQALEASLKKMLLKKSLDKITIQDLTSDCGISRMAFYYHFKDIYDLVEWACYEDAAKALQGKKTYVPTISPVVFRRRRYLYVVTRMASGLAEAQDVYKRQLPT